MKDNKKIKIIHIAPAAFDYFEDIKANVLNLAEGQRKLGLDVEVATLQYGPDSRKQIEQTGKTFPGLGQSGFYNIDEIITHLPEFDIIHLHAPFLGVGKVWRWLRENNKAKLCITFYHGVESSDLFSWFVILYNGIFLPRVFRRAGLIVANDKQKFMDTFGKKYLNSDYPVVDLREVMENIVRENIHLTNTVDKVKLSIEESRVLAYFQLYNYLIQ